MSTFSLNTYTAGDVLTAGQLNSDNRKIEGVIDGLSINDLTEKYAIVAYPFYFADIGTSTTRQFKVRINTDSIITKLDYSVLSRSPTSSTDQLTLTVQKADDHTTLSTAVTILTNTQGNSQTYGSMLTFGPSSFNNIAGTSTPNINLATNNYVLFTLANSSGSTSFSDINVTLTIKTLLQA
tara:strand:- start:12 stop:554 length:543 start_codon:yes stop_codon:yes gene_type:complete